MKTKASVIFLILLSLTPHYISLYQLQSNGGLTWPMLWGNEKVFWGLVFIGFAVLAVIVALKYKHNHPVFTNTSIVLAIIAVAPAMYDVIVQGLGPSSKMDSDQLDIMSFWISNWWK